MNKRLSIQIGHQEMKRLQDLKIGLRDSELERKITLGLSPCKSTQSPDHFKKMTDEQLLDNTHHSGAVDVLRNKIMRKRTMVRFFAQAIDDIRKQDEKELAE